MSENFANDLHEVMRRWGWPEWKIQQFLPRVLKILAGVGILVRHDDTYLPTELVEDDATWERAWDLLEKEGVAGPEGPAC